jgi:hypothetical protein
MTKQELIEELVLMATKGGDVVICNPDLEDYCVTFRVKLVP